MKLIITRPEEDAAPLIEKLERLGHDCISLPLLEIIPRATVTVPGPSYQAICLTSANGIRAAQIAPDLLHLPVFTVGPQSKAEAQRRGFNHVSAHGGDVAGLARFIAGHLQPENGPILYLSGAETSGDLEGKLKAQKFKVDRVIAYDAEPAHIADFTKIVADADAVLLYSPRSAQLWHSQVESHDCDGHIKKLDHFCLSSNVAAKLPQSWVKRVARSPDESGMFLLLEQSEEEE
jgi:uroporphyrinogen-III synthase